MVTALHSMDRQPVYSTQAIKKEYLNKMVFCQHAAFVGARGLRAVRLRLHARVALGAAAGAAPGRHLYPGAGGEAPLRVVRQREREESA